MNVESAVRNVKVFVSSPVDVASERGRVQAVAAKLNREYDGLVRFSTVLWEEHFYKADRSFQPQIPESVACDVLVSIFWTRVGTELPTDFARMPNGRPYPSGTAYELLTALAASKSKGVPDVYVFRKTADAALPTADLDRRRQAQTQLDALEAFWSEWFKSDQGQFKAAFQTFGDTDEFERQIEQLLRQWLESHHLLGPRLRWPKEKGSPFPGLASFEADQAAVFFGRDRAIDDARRRLMIAAENKTPFLLIVGASGSGKSSLARAGLIPRLTTPGVVAAVELWRSALMKPSEGGIGPVSSLATALFTALPELAQGDFPTPAALADNLRRGGASAARPVLGALARVAETAQRERHSDQALRPALVLLIDQLEELFAQAVADAERAAFAEAIKELLATGEVWCIATLRADLYELLLKQPVLKALKEAGANLDLGPPGPAELAEIVCAPAAAAGIVFDNDPQKGALDERLLADAKTADSLPLLQFTLRQLYDRRVETDGETRLTHAAYEALGGLQGAIAAEAERAVANLPAATLAALPQLLRQLAEPARDGKTLTLREMAQAEIAAKPAETALVQALLGARILIARQDATGCPTLRLAHDAVLISWPRAQAAAQANRDFYRVRAEVEDALWLWKEHGQPKDRLLQPGVQLAEAEKLATDFARELPAELLGYVAASRKRARARLRLLAAAAIFFLALAVAATGSTIFAVRARQEAERQRQRAEETLAAATQTANSLVFDLVQRFRDAVGVPTELIKDILDRALTLEEELIKAGQATPELKRNEADGLMEMVTTLLDIGDTTAALAAAERSRQIFADLIVADPNNTELQRELSVSYNRIGDVQEAQSNMPGALASFQAGLVIIKQLAESHPENNGWQRDLSVSYNRVGDAQVAIGDLPQGIASYQAGLAVIERLAKSDPANLGWRYDVSVSYEKIGDVQKAQGDLASALKSYQTSTAIRDQLAKSDPGNASWQRNLSVAYNKVGDVLVAQGDLPAALDSYQAGLVIIERLAKSDPGNATWQRDLAISYDKIGDVQAAQGNLPQALAAYQAALGVMVRLAKTNPGNTSWQRDLSVAYNRVGNVQVAQGNLPAALASYRAGLDVIERLARSDPSNTGWQRDLTVSYNKVGDVLLAQGSLPEALAAFQAGLVVIERLTKFDPGNTAWQRDLLFSYNRVGDVLLAQHNLQQALASYQAGLAVIESLTKSDPDNTGLQRDLAVAYGKLATVYTEAGQTADALAALRQGEAVMQRLVNLAPDNIGWKNDLAWFERQIAALTPANP